MKNKQIWLLHFSPRKKVMPFIFWGNKKYLDLMQFNILADGLSSIHQPKNEMFKNHIRDCLVFDYRGFRLIEEIIRFKPDIITLQEVDQIHFLNHYLSPFGYKYVHCIKPRSPCLWVAQENNKDLLPDGSAVFWYYIHIYFLVSVCQRPRPFPRTRFFTPLIMFRHCGQNGIATIMYG